LTADHLVIVGRGRLLADISMAEMTASVTPSVRLRTPQREELVRLLQRPDVTVQQIGPDVLSVTGRSSDEIARIALSSRVLLQELTPVHASLEDAYLALTGAEVEYRSAPLPAPPTVPTHTDSRRAAA
jgi:ABC-2 type transport system ATP-binding protein